MSTKKFSKQALLAFLTPLVVRSVPEIISWPYPLGFDTVFSYVPWIKSRYPLNIEVTKFLKGTNMLPLLTTLLNDYLVRDPILTVKLLGPLLYALLGLSIYIFSRKVLNWSPNKSFLLVSIYSIYFISLRISWEMYRQMLGTIFLFLTLTIYRSANNKVSNILVPILSILTIFSHEITGVTLTAILLGEAIAGFLERNEKGLTIVFSLLVLVTTLCYMIFDPFSKELRLSLERFDESRYSIAQHVLGFLLYSYSFLIPFTLYGLIKLRNRIIYSWLCFTFLISIWPIIYPQASPPFWFRWAIFTVYPILMLFVEGFHRALSCVASKGAKTVIVLYISFIIFTGTWYLVADPEHAFPYFSDYNPYKAYIQTSMIQSTIPIKDIEPTMKAIRWLLEYSNGTIVLHEAFYPWATLYEKVPRKTILVSERDLSKIYRRTFADALTEISKKTNGDNEIYTIWWIEGKGWYNVPSLPNSFIPVISFDNICIYKLRDKVDK